MATIRKKGEYQWHVQIRRSGYPSQTKTFETKQEAEAWAATIESEMARCIFISRTLAEKITLSELLERYEKEVVEHQRGKVKYRSLIRNLSARLGKYSLASITPIVLSKYRDVRSKEVSPQAVKHDLSMLSRAFNTAIKEWGIHFPHGNPVSHIRLPKVPQGRDRRLKPGELELIIENSESPTLGKIVLFALETAMRRSEIARMTWDMVDLKKRTVTLLDTKNGERRIVPLSTEAIRILKDIPRDRFDGKVWGITEEAITRAFDRACKRARVKIEEEAKKSNRKLNSLLVDFRFHDLRHEATSRFFEKGLNPMQVAAITGHKTLQMLKRYTHLKAEDLAELLK